MDDRNHQDFERKETARSPLSTLVERCPLTSTNTVDEAVASEDTDYADTACYNTDDGTSTLINSDSRSDSGNEADTEDGTAFDGDSNDEDPYRDIVPQNAASENDCPVRLSGWQLGDMVRKSDPIGLLGKRGRDSDEDSESDFELRRALKRRRGRILGWTRAGPALASRAGKGRGLTCII